MSKRDVFFVALRLMGVYFVLLALSNVPVLIGFLSHANTTGFGQISFIFALGIYVTGSVFLIVWADALAGWLAGREKEETSAPAIDRRGMQSVAFSALGLYTVLQGLPYLFSCLGRLCTSEPLADAFPGGWRFVVGPTARVLIGLWLLFGSQALVRLVNRAHDAGHVKPEPE